MDDILSDNWLSDLLAPTKVRKKPKKRYTKPKEVRILESDIYEAKKLARPGNPGVVKPKFRDDTANGLTKCIVAWMELNGYFAGRINTQGNYSKKLGQYVRSGSKKGMADVTGVINGKHVSVEVKIGKDKPRDSQLKVKEQIESAGGVYLFVSGFSDFLKQINHFICESKA